jgi:hypothetical protein
MTSKHEDKATPIGNIKTNNHIKAQPLLIWQEAPQSAGKQSSKVVDMGDYMRSQEALSEASILSWNIPAVDGNKSVKLIMVSSGFKIRGIGANNIQSMAA